MSEHDTDILEEVAEEEEELTDQEKLENDIAVEEAKLRIERNLWGQWSLDQMYIRLETMFDADGMSIPQVPLTSQLIVDFSPQEAQEADGYWTHFPDGYGDLPPWLGESDPAVGLTMTNERHDGCAGIKNMDMVSDLWINDPASVVAQITAKASSERVVAMAGYRMAGQKFFLPMFDHPGADGLTGFAVLPNIPISDEERLAYRKNWGKYQMKVMLGGSFRNHDVVWNDDPTAIRSQWKMLVDPIGLRHKITTIINHPNWVVPALMDYFNTPLFMREFYNTERARASRIDIGAENPVPGYVKQDGAYRTRFEPHDKASHIAFTLPSLG